MKRLLKTLAILAVALGAAHCVDQSGGRSTSSGPIHGGPAAGAGFPAVEEAHWDTRLLAISVNTTEAYEDLSRVQFQMIGSQSEPATSVGMRVSVPDADFLDILAFSLTQFADDSGQDLGDGTVKDPDRMDRTPIFQAGRHAALIRLGSDKSPAASARWLHVSGSTVLRVGIGQTEFPAVTMPLRLGRTLSIPGGSLVIDSLDEVDRGTGRGVLIHFIASGDMRLIKTLRISASGMPEVPAPEVSQFNNRTMVQVELPTRPDLITVQPVLYTKIESRVIPIDQKIGIGVTQREEQ